MIWARLDVAVSRNRLSTLFLSEGEFILFYILLFSLLFLFNFECVYWFCGLNFEKREKTLLCVMMGKVLKWDLWKVTVRCVFFFFFVSVDIAAIVCCAITSFPVLFVVFGIWKFLFVLSVGAFCSCMWGKRRCLILFQLWTILRTICDCDIFELYLQFYRWSEMRTRSRD